MEIISSLLKSLHPNQVTEVFIATIFIVSILAVAFFFTNRLQNFVKIVPSLLSSFGILGTFIGIAIGLAKFNVKEIDASIPYLLDGMNTAFITSIFGIFCGLFVKIILSLSTASKKITTEQIGAAHIHEAIQEQTQQLVQIQASIAKQSKVISKATNYLHKDFQEFAQQISEVSSKHLIEALENVIRDFNTRLSSF